MTLEEAKNKIDYILLALQNNEIGYLYAKEEMDKILDEFEITIRLKIMEQLKYQGGKIWPEERNESY